MQIEKIAQNLHRLERGVLPFLEKTTELKSLVKESGMQQVEVMRALQWLSNKKVIKLSQEEKNQIELGNNGKEYRDKGLPEKRFLIAIKDEALKVSEIIKEAELDGNEINICIGTLKSKAAIDVKKDKELSFSITDAGKNLLSKQTLEEKFLLKEFPMALSDLKPEEKFSYQSLVKRKDIILVNKVIIRTFELTDLGKKLVKVKISDDTVDKLTPKMLKTGTWQKKKFRAYDVSINVPKVYGGKRHYVNQAMDYIRKIWLELGFEEMSGNLVQTSFWDLDALFVPQDHPAREEQDTFYIKDPKFGTLPSIWKKFKEIHENGGDTGSKGWGGKYSEEIAKENLLRTHTTVLSAQTLSKLKKEDLPRKFFSVKKVFRNEAMDMKHLFELTQVEGIVVDPDANFQHLKGYLREFFTKMGYADVRIRPGHFPYTEPSAEVEVYDSSRKQWIELGGSGIFRPELTKPLLGFECPVLAWGLGMERTIAEYWNIKDIRDLYKNDLKQIREMKFYI